MRKKVFISYRRDDSAGYAGRMHDRLMRDLGGEFLFMDVDAIPPGANFVKVLQDEVSQCAVLLAMIGAHWLDARDERGNRRLDNPDDFVRIEIATALGRDIPVVPILLDGAGIPKSDQLPDDLRELTLRNALEVRHASFHFDMDKLIGWLKQQLGVLGGESATVRQRYSAEPPSPAPASSQFELGWKHEKGLDGFSVDKHEAARLYKLAADQGDARAQFRLGRFYDNGEGGLPEDEREAARLYRLAADQGNSGAQSNLARLYSAGLGGLPKDDREAARLYKLAADQGNAIAQQRLANFHLYGRGGVPKDDREAVRLYKLSAKQGDHDAQATLGALYLLGRDGLPQDFREAAHHLKLAADQGNLYAAADLSMIESINKMDPSQRALLLKFRELTFAVQTD
jgi:TPR repeat protein